MADFSSDSENVFSQNCSGYIDLFFKFPSSLGVFPWWYFPFCITIYIKHIACVTLWLFLHYDKLYVLIGVNSRCCCVHDWLHTLSTRIISTDACYLQVLLLSASHPKICGSLRLNMFCARPQMDTYSIIEYYFMIISTLVYQ